MRQDPRSPATRSGVPQRRPRPSLRSARRSGWHDGRRRPVHHRTETWRPASPPRHSDRSTHRGHRRRALPAWRSMSVSSLAPRAGLPRGRHGPPRPEHMAHRTPGIGWQFGPGGFWWLIGSRQPNRTGQRPAAVPDSVNHCVCRCRPRRRERTESPHFPKPIPSPETRWLPADT